MESILLKNSIYIGKIEKTYNGTQYFNIHFKISGNDSIKNTLQNTEHVF